MLNTAQMRDAVHLQRFRVSSESLDIEDIIHTSAIRELNSEKALGRERVTKAPQPAKPRAPQLTTDPHTLNARSGPSSLSRAHPVPRRFTNLVPEQQ